MQLRGIGSRPANVTQARTMTDRNLEHAERISPSRVDSLQST